tara:strand:- start:307 stop:537 length:231 start_codon:yes stop_codon:yes gene_type:complete
MNTNQINEIKRLLNLSENALDKVEFNYNGTKVLNPSQQSVSTRFYNKAYNLKGDLTIREFAMIHKEVIDQRRETSN